MKSLHKKIAAGALVVLLLGVPVAHASIFRGIYIPGGKVHQNLPSSKQDELRVPFLVGSQLYVADDALKAKNDKNIVYGAHEIFEYRIFSLYPQKDRWVKDLKIGPKGKERDFADGNEFLRYLAYRGVKKGMYIAKVGNQSYMLQFDKDLKAGKMWWLELDKWQYGAEVFFKSKGGKY